MKPWRHWIEYLPDYLVSKSEVKAGFDNLEIYCYVQMHIIENEGKAILIWSRCLYTLYRSWLPAANITIMQPEKQQ